ncbi:MAG TPA: HAD-IA family hydrolase [Candidatus Saccharimonadales bacterium]|nr:HAD-IA family hydrolase [Candidatus Saccharimonadales bacterium]
MIRFVYLDVGGVALKDFSRSTKWQEFKKDIGVGTDIDEDFDTFFSEYVDKICIGMNIEKLLPLITKKFGLNFSPDYSLLEDFVNRFEKNETIDNVLEVISEDRRVGLLTNMYTGMLDSINNKKLLPEFTWDVIIDSSIEGVLKPQKEIFELAQKRAGVRAEEILFVENTKKHVDVAKSLGWNTFLYDSSDYPKASEDLMKEIVGLLK